MGHCGCPPNQYCGRCLPACEECAERRTPADGTDETVITDRTWRGTQSWYRERVVVRNGRRLRYYVRCDAYKFQSYAEVSIWRDDHWHDIHRIAGELIRTEASYVSHGVQAVAFEDDVAELRRVAIAVIE